MIRLGDRSGDERVEIIDKTGSNRIVITSSDNKISIEAVGDIDITSSSGKLTMSAIGVEINSQAGVKIQAATRWTSMPTRRSASRAHWSN